MPPALILFNEYGGEWRAYEDALYLVFTQQISRGLTFRGDEVSCRRIPETDQRWAAFWHLIQEGKVEDDRTPDIRRCERLAWIPWVIANWNDPAAEIQWWENRRGNQTNVLLWYREEYLVILARRNGYWLLKSAYQTEKAHRVRSLREERDKFHGA